MARPSDDRARRCQPRVYSDRSTHRYRRRRRANHGRNDDGDLAVTALLQRAAPPHRCNATRGPEASTPTHLVCCAPLARGIGFAARPCSPASRHAPRGNHHPPFFPTPRRNIHRPCLLQASCVTRLSLSRCPVQRGTRPNAAVAGGAPGQARNCSGKAFRPFATEPGGSIADVPQLDTVIKLPCRWLWLVVGLHLGPCACPVPWIRLGS